MPACVARPALTEGPYFVDEKLNRSDIRSDPSDGSVRQGALLALTFRVSQLTNACAPLGGASVDVWHCDAAGIYSDVSDPGFSTVGKKFLRGYQVTDSSGVAKFTTIYPGWYQGRAVHIHFKIRSHTGSGSAYEFTSQLFFDDNITDQVYTQAPYSARGQRTLRNRWRQHLPPGRQPAPAGSNEDRLRATAPPSTSACRCRKATHVTPAGTLSNRNHLTSGLAIDTAGQTRKEIRSHETVARPPRG